MKKKRDKKNLPKSKFLESSKRLHSSSFLKMKSSSFDDKKISKGLYWTPRVLSILFILFLAMFSLDIFDMKLGFWGTILGLFMHNIPSLILLIVVIISWKHEIVGGIAFISAGILYIAQLVMTILMNPPPQWYMLSWSVIIAGPAILIGVLYFINWNLKRKS